MRAQVVEAAQSADGGTLEGVLPLLTHDGVDVARLPLPNRFSGHRLVDQDLQFLRQKLNVSVLGVLIPGEERWRAGGPIAVLELPAGTELLMAGAPDTISYLRLLIATDNDDLWHKVS